MPTDLNQRAKAIVDLATRHGEDEDDEKKTDSDATESARPS
jgi:hypothetical protein